MGPAGSLTPSPHGEGLSGADETLPGRRGRAAWAEKAESRPPASCGCTVFASKSLENRALPGRHLGFLANGLLMPKPPGCPGGSLVLPEESPAGYGFAGRRGAIVDTLFLSGIRARRREELHRPGQHSCRQASSPLSGCRAVGLGREPEEPEAQGGK